MSRTIILKLTAAIGISGEVLRKGSLVEVTESEAKDLMRRGKAVLHDHDPESGESVFASSKPASEAAEREAADQAETDAADAGDGALMDNRPDHEKKAAAAGKKHGRSK